MKKVVYFLLILLTAYPLFTMTGQTNNEKSGIKISGYVQGDYEIGQKEANLYVGDQNTQKQSTFGRAGIRRGRLKMEYILPSNPDLRFVGQINMTEKGINPFQIYADFTHVFKYDDSKINSLALGLRGGLDSYHFGLEPQEGSKARLAPEYTPYYCVMFPGIDDFMAGGHLNMKLGEGTNTMQKIGLQLYLLSGNGRAAMRKSIPDATFDLRHTISTGSFEAFYGLSYYLGYVPQTDKGDNDRIKRNYLSLYTRLGMTSKAGKTRLSAEYISGNQPGKLYESTVTGPQYDSKHYNDGQEIFSRGFWGMSLQLDHRFNFAPIGLFYKYYYYNKRDLLSGNKSLWAKYLDFDYASSVADGTESTNGFGLNVFLFDDHLRLTGFYECINSKRAPSEAYTFYKDPEDNRFIFRIQYNF